MPLDKETALSRLYNMNVVDPIYTKESEKRVDDSANRTVRIIETTTVKREVILNG